MQMLDLTMALAYTSASMRLATYADEHGRWRAGVLSGTSIVDAAIAAREGTHARDGERPPAMSVKEILRRPEAFRASLGENAAEIAERGEGIAQAQVRLGPPVPDPEKVVCVGLNYPAHAVEFDAPIPTTPVLFAKFPSSLIGTNDVIRLPRISEQVDWEGELAVVIGRECHSVPAARATEVIAGCMPFNDVTARDLQFETSQWLAGKALDTFAPCGPALVSLDEIGDLQDLELRTRVNRVVMQEASTRNMIFSVAEIVAYVSQLMTLRPGDIIATGTPEGVGFRRNPPLFLSAGDVVEVEVQGLGTLVNRVDEPSEDDPVLELGPGIRAGGRA